ncbi:MAG TPA: transketolase [Candidatus Dormibacteraeota bacterium]|nr:transketolase [Candidatus Dormibacteraeota bacterium]
MSHGAGAGDAAAGGATAQLVAATALAVRRRVLEHTVDNGGGYLSQACSAAEILASLYLQVMRLGPSAGPMEPERFPGTPGHGTDRLDLGARYNGAPDDALDRFVLSPAHYALVLYATLIAVGRLGPDALGQFNADGSTVEMIGAEHSPGMEVTSGSLGQALSVAVGRALARQRRRARGRVWVFMSDGEFQEGQTWEALQAAAWLGLDRLGVYVDANGSQCDGPIDQVMPIEPLVAKLRAFGWSAVEVDGHDPAALHAAAGSGAGRPLAVVCRTSPWRGIPSLRRRAPRLHYVRLDPAEAEAARADLARAAAAAGVAP